MGKSGNGAVSSLSTISSLPTSTCCSLSTSTEISDEGWEVATGEFETRVFHISLIYNTNRTCIVYIDFCAGKRRKKRREQNATNVEVTSKRAFAENDAWN